MINTRHFAILLAFLTLALAIPIALQVRHEKIRRQYSLTPNTNSSQNISYNPQSKAVLAATSGASSCEQQGFQCANTADECIGESGGVTSKGSCSGGQVCCIVKKPACADAGGFCDADPQLPSCFLIGSGFSCSGANQYCCLKESPSCETDVVNGTCTSENVCGGAMISNAKLCSGSVNNPNIVCCVKPSAAPTSTPVPTTGSNTPSNPQPTATPTGLPTSPLCGGEYVCDPCDCPAGQTCDQKCYTATTHELCLTQSCSNDPSSQIFTQTCTPQTDQLYSFCTSAPPNGMGFTPVSCAAGSECTGTGGGGCGYCQTRVMPTATPASFSFAESQTCSANYSITENSNKKDVVISISASTNNASCPVLLRDGVYDSSISCKNINGRLECGVKNVGNGKHFFELRFGQSALYSKNCGAPISCNSVEFSLSESVNNTLFGDIDNNGSVTVSDFTSFKECYTNISCTGRSSLDLNTDGSVDIVDYNIMLSRVTL